MTDTTEVTYDPRLHVRVAADVRKKIAAGVLAAGDPVSITYTAQEWGSAGRPRKRRCARWSTMAC
jgi:hypothetical protein